jgi:hypothetical protein
METTAILTITSIDGDSDIDGIQEIYLQESVRPVWRISRPEWSTATTVFASFDRSLACGLAAILVARGTLFKRTGIELPVTPEAPLILNDDECIRLYREFAETTATLWRLDGSCLDDQEIAMAIVCGFGIEVVDLPWSESSRIKRLAETEIAQEQTSDAVRFTGSDWLDCDPADFPEAPYPGERAPGSWLLNEDGLLHGLDYVGNGWIDRRTEEVVNLAGRHMVLGYGSNLNPVKLSGQYQDNRVIVLQAKVKGWSAVWCNARRGSGTGDVVATLAETPGICELHAIVAVTDEQLKKMDEWEGHPRCYGRQQFAGDVVLESGSIGGVQVYMGTEERRPALRIDGQLARVGDIPYDEVDKIVRKRQRQ